MSSAIITFAVGSKFEDIRYFVQSAQINAPYSYLYIFVGDNIKELKYQCDIFPGVYLLPYKESQFTCLMTKAMKCIGFSSDKWSWILRHRFIYKWIPIPIRDAVTRCLAPETLRRFFLIRKLLKTLPYDQVMISESRDVLILANPFTNMKDNQIVSGAESISIGEDRKSNQCLREIYSSEVFEQLKTQPLINAGVTIGSKCAIAQYLKEMIEEIYNRLPASLNRSCSDQAIHMKVFYSGLKGLEKSLETNGDGKIATLNFSSIQGFDLKNGSIQNKNGKQLAIVHYYDQNSELVNYLKGFILSKQIIFTHAWDFRWQR